jgi:hypothetical protein
MRYSTRGAALLLAAAGAACGRDAPTAPESVAEESARWGDIVPTAEQAAHVIALEDVLGRLLPALGDRVAAERLRPPLSELVAALNGGETNHPAAPLGIAERVLERVAGTPGLADEHGADLDAIRLVLEHIATSLDTFTSTSR